MNAENRGIDILEKEEAMKLQELRDSGLLQPSSQSRRQRRSVLNQPLPYGDNSNKLKAQTNKQNKVRAKTKQAKKSRKKNR